MTEMYFQYLLKHHIKIILIYKRGSIAIYNSTSLQMRDNKAADKSKCPQYAAKPPDTTFPMMQ